MDVVENKKGTGSDILQFIKDSLPKYFASISLTGSLIGFSLLFWYCNNNQIPFPIEFGSLPTLLIITAFIGIAIITILSAFLFFPSIFVILSNTNKKNFGSRVLEIYEAVNLKNIFLLFCLHGTAATWLNFYIVLFAMQKPFNIDPTLFLLVLGIFFSLLFLLSNAYTCLNVWKRTKILGVKLFFIKGFCNAFFASVMLVWSFVLLRFLILVMQKTPLNDYEYPDDSLAPYIIIFLVGVFILALGYFIIKLSHKEQFGVLAIVIAVVISIFSVISPEIASFLGKGSMRALHIGGGVKTCYLLDKKSKNIVFSQATQDEKTTPVLFKMLDIGSRVYVKTSDKSGKVFLISKKNIINEYIPAKDKDSDEAQNCLF